MSQASSGRTVQITSSREESSEAGNKVFQPLAKLAAKALVVSAFGSTHLSVFEPSRELFEALGVRDGNVVSVIDPRGFAFNSRARYIKNRVYIAVPKIFARYYERGEEVTVLLTILPEVVKHPKPRITK